MKQEKATLYTLENLDNMELLSATYISQKFPAHYHDTFCIGVLEEGSEILSFSDRDLIVPANSIILINPNEVHANYALDEDGWKYKMMYVNGDILKYIASQVEGFQYPTICFEHFCFRDEFVFGKIKSLFNFSEEKPFQDIEQQLTSILTYLIVNYGVENKNHTIEYENNIKDLKSFLDEKFDTKLNLDDIAKTTGVNKFKIIREFKKSTGLTPLSYVLYKRIQKAKILIKENIKLSHVALESGFYDQSHFSKYFKNYVGVTPISYLQSCNILQDSNKCSI